MFGTSLTMVLLLLPRRPLLLAATCAVQQQLASRLRR
jgi:hypothetical protein